MNYLRDQYTDRRPESRNAFERWLGRDTIYPSQTLVLPTEEEISEAIRKAVAEDESEGLTADRNVLVFGTLLRWLWEHNADAHEFFVEESFPIRWTYDYAVPHGLIYRLNRTKLDKLPPEDVARDMAFWKDYKNRLLNDPNFKNDFDAQRSFSKLRFTIGNIYAHRKMTAEAEQAYREALELWPSNPDAIVALSRILWEHGDFDEVLRLYDVALSIDPNSFDLWRLRFLAEDRKTLQGEIQTLEQKLARQPLNADVVRTLIGLYDAVDATNKSVPLAQAALTNFPDDPEMLRALIAHWEGIGDLPATLEPARQLAVADPTNFQNYLLLSRAWFLHNKKPEFYEAAEKAATLGGDRIRTAFKDNPMFQAWTNDPEFQKLVTPTPLAPAR